MCVDYGDDYEYARSRLSGSIVRLNTGEPAYIDTIQSDTGETTYFLIGDPGRTFHSKSLKEFNLEPIPLGYVNLERDSHYIVRVPQRQWRQGLRPPLIMSYPTTSREALIYSGGFANMVMKVYPSLDTSVESLVTEERMSVAFSKDFCLVKKKSSSVLVYKGMNTVGHLEVKDFPLLRLNKKFEYLGEHLQESLQ